MTQAFSDIPLFSCWPFWVLELTPMATTQDIEKAARDIIGKLQFGVKGADTYASPLGNTARDEFTVREAKAALQDPLKRLLAEFWYVTPSITSSENFPQSNTVPSLAEWNALFGNK